MVSGDKVYLIDEKNEVFVASICTFCYNVYGEKELKQRGVSEMVKVVFEFSPSGLAAAHKSKDDVLNVFRKYANRSGAVETEEGVFVKDGEDSFPFGGVILDFIEENLWALDTVKSMVMDIEGEVVDYKESFLSFCERNPWAKKYLMKTA